MPNNWLAAFQSLLTPDVVGRMASATGEPNSAVSGAASVAGPLILAGVVQQAGDLGLMTQVMRLLHSPTVGGNPLGNLGNLFGPTRTPLIEQGSKFLTAIFGNRVDTVAAALSQHAGIRTGSAARILGFVAPILMTLLGQRVRAENLTVGGLSRWLQGLRRELGGLPAPLVHDAGLEDLRDSVPAISQASAAEVQPVRRWVVSAGMGLLLLFGFWFLLARPQVPSVPVVEGLFDTAPEPQPARMAPEGGALVRRQLPNGESLNLPSRGVEIQLIEFIEDRSQPLKPPRWFNFEQILFEANSATLRPASEKQLQTIARILMAYPTVHFMIVGLPDRIGNQAADRKLSLDRATTALTRLTRLGVSKERLAVNPGTDDGNAQDRGIALRVTRR